MTDKLLPTPKAQDAKHGALTPSEVANPKRYVNLHMALTSPSSPGSEDSTSPSKPSASDASARSSSTPPVPESSNDGGRLFPVGDGFRSSALLPTPNAMDSIGQRSEEAKERQLRRGKPSGSRRSRSGNLREDIPALLHTPTSDSSIRENRYAQGGANLGHDLASISSAVGFHASPSASPVDVEPRPTTGGSGPSSPESFAILDPDGSWLKTSPDSSVQASLLGQLLVRFSGTWPRWGSMRDGEAFALPTLERPTAASGSSYLHTPTTGDTVPNYDHRASPGYVRAIPVPNLNAQVSELFQTPSAADAMGGHLSRGGDRSDELLLKGQVKALLPTPNAGTTPNGHGRRGGQPNGHQSGADLEPTVRTLLPSPIARDHQGAGAAGRSGGDNLPDTLTKLLPTPDSYEGSRGGPQTAEKREGHTLNLSDAVHSLGDPTNPPSEGGNE